MFDIIYCDKNIYKLLRKNKIYDINNYNTELELSDIYEVLV